MRALLPLFPVLPFLLFLNTALGQILAIDYGLDSFKLSLVRPGRPFDVLLDSDSKRKLSSCITIPASADLRLFGASAAAAAGKFPHRSVCGLKAVLGQPAFSAASVRFSETFPALNVSQNSRGGVQVALPDGQVWSTEELLAMQFEYARLLAVDAFGGVVREAVITVPAHFTFGQRQAVSDAVTLAGLKAVAFLHDGSAVALNYALARSFPNSSAHLHVIFDSGASGARASLFNFSSSAAGGKETLVSALGYAFEPNTGGQDIDLLLRDMLAGQFEQRHGDKVDGWRGNGRAWNKLLAEARRVKVVLSANLVVGSFIESLHEDFDHRASVTRDQLEEAMTSSGMAAKFALPLSAVLERANLTKADISSVILAGGTSRVPMVQASLKAFLQDDEKLAVNVNADEAAVLGAAFYGASVSRQFRTKNIRLQDFVPFEVAATYAETAESEKKSQVIFEQFSPSGRQAVLEFNRPDDFEVTVGYTNPPAEMPADFMSIKVEGNAALFSNLTEEEKAVAVVRVKLEHSDNGIIWVPSSTLVIPGKDAGIAEYLKNMLKSENNKDVDEADMDSILKNIDTSNSTKRDRSIKLGSLIQPISMPPLTAENKTSSTARLRALSAAEKAIKARSEALNSLETYLYALRDILADEVAHIGFHGHSLAGERKKIQYLLDQTIKFMDDESDKASTEKLIAKRKDLQKLEDPIRKRTMESAGRIKAVPDFQKALNAGRGFLTSALQNNTVELAANRTVRYTEEELDEVEKDIDTLEAWFKKQSAAQGKLKSTDDPVLLVEDLETKGRKLQDKVMKLIRRPIRIKIPKEQWKNTGKNSKKNDTNDTAENNSTKVGASEDVSNSTEIPKGDEETVPVTPVNDNQPVLEDDEPQVDEEPLTKSHARDDL